MRKKGSTHKIEAVNIGFLNPTLKLIGYLLRRSHRCCTKTTKA
jgi:hypothetical protein